MGVWAAPDPAADTSGGAAVRALVLPQLFVARPDGRWTSMLAAPGSDATADDRRSATLRLRAGATWSDGSPITAEDLRRTADPRFVAGVEGPTGDGTITLRFTTELPGWRRLWSGRDAIAAPRPGVWGGPFLVGPVTPGLETVLAPNPRWWGEHGPFLDEVRLVLLPDATTARLLLSRGDLDVVMPLAATHRTPQLERIPRVSLDTADRGGAAVSLELNPDRLSLEQRRAVRASFPRAHFVRVLLGGEVAGDAGDAGDVADGGDGESAFGGATVDLIGFAEEPMTALVHRSMQKRARAGGATIELRQAEADRVEGWLRDGDFDAAVAVHTDPLGGCWSCRWPDVPEASAADAGDPEALTALKERLRSEARSVPLWRSRTVLATREGLAGPAANGYALSAAWNAWEWWRPRR